MSEVENVHRSGATIGHENPMGSLWSHTVRLLQSVGGGLFFFRTSDDVDRPTQNEVRRVLDILGRETRGQKSCVRSHFDRGCETDSEAQAPTT
jgi:hypothetical protein